ncbi:hypothetical protein [Paracoccus niistensis]|uniref:Disulfide bond formation protein B n=1 Tax=Paracoccus niistensis TaxID=632935 RepID=A0ABV6I3Y0_9RHOB
MALAAWLTAAAATLVLPGCSFTSGAAEGCRLLGRDISGRIYDLASASPVLLAIAALWFATMSLIIALIKPRRN